ncbi:LOW QUALITY PROTEIN: DAPK2 isoform 3 [Pan troglodytes]|uniref:Death associated protein kinase 2 n=2 Tax=Homininae TaxID=207598 RepID=H0YLP5_HUMAN|nr:death associated protein kinase 2 [Homo sapiens]KAI4058203.1 death associated protein kinase 2 [Homo sapiens]PNI74446.1 LOW QUALITY PROTEIN: DAPK2 isoform 3 [Pan troglodytes]
MFQASMRSPNMEPFKQQKVEDFYDIGEELGRFLAGILLFQTLHLLLTLLLLPACFSLLSCPSSSQRTAHLALWPVCHREEVPGEEHGA